MLSTHFHWRAHCHEDDSRAVSWEKVLLPHDESLCEQHRICSCSGKCCHSLTASMSHDSRLGMSSTPKKNGTPKMELSTRSHFSRILFNSSMILNGGRLRLIGGMCKAQFVFPSLLITQYCFRQVFGSKVRATRDCARTNPHSGVAQLAAQRAARKVMT